MDQISNTEILQAKLNQELQKEENLIVSQI